MFSVELYGSLKNRIDKLLFIMAATHDRVIGGTLLKLRKQYDDLLEDYATVIKKSYYDNCQAEIINLDWEIEYLRKQILTLEQSRDTSQNDKYKKVTLEGCGYKMDEMRKYRNKVVQTIFKGTHEQQSSAAAEFRRINDELNEMIEQESKLLQTGQQLISKI